MNAEFFVLAFGAALNPKLLAIDLLPARNRRARAMFVCVLAGGLSVALAAGRLPGRRLLIQRWEVEHPEAHAENEAAMLHRPAKTPSRSSGLRHIPLSAVNVCYRYVIEFSATYIDQFCGNTLNLRTPAPPMI